MSSKYSASTVESSLSKLTIIYQATGLQYFSINAESLKSTTRGSISISRKHKLYFVLNITLVFVEVCAATFLSMRIQKQNHQHNTSTGLIVQCAAYSLLFLVIIVAMLNSFFLRAKAQKIYKNCNKVAEILSILNEGADYSLFDYQFKTTIAKLFLSFILLMVALLSFTYRFNRTNFFGAICLIYPYMLMITIFSYWTLLVRLIRENLRFIQKCLNRMHKRQQLFRISPAAHNHGLRVRRNQEMYNFIGKLKRIYAIIYDSTSLVNELIGIPIFMLMVSIVVSNISGGYKVFLFVRGEFPVVQIGVPFCTILITSTILCTLISSCSSTYAAVNEILTSVHKFEFTMYERDTGISAILLEFANQMVQRPIEFMVGGFYCLTLPLLATITTGIFTYILLLVQFHTPS